MKNLKSIFAAAVFMCCSQVALADDFKVGNLGYTIIEGTNTVKVSSFSHSYEGSLNPGDGETPPEADVKRRSAGAILTYSLVIPQVVKHSDVAYTIVAIDAKLFADCVHMAEVSIPATVTSIGNGAFGGCTALKKLTCYIDNPLSLTADSKVFEGVDKSLCELVVFNSKQQAYKDADVWGDFKFDTVLRDYTVSDVSAIIDYILAEDKSLFNHESLDVNNDGDADLEDVESILTKILNR